LNTNNTNNNNNQNSSSCTTNKKVASEDTCHIHGGHKWKACLFNPNGNNYHPRTARNNNSNNNNRGDSHDTNSSNNNNTNNSNNNNGLGNNNNNSTPSSYGDQHHFELVPESGIEMDWNDNFLLTLEVELDPAKLSEAEAISPKPTFIPVKDDGIKLHDLVPSTIMSVKSGC
jgi:hypothetical protein